VFFLRFKQEIRQVAFIRTIPNLVILEHDAYQNYIPASTPASSVRTTASCRGRG
jgi:hypothetical protein